MNSINFITTTKWSWFRLLKIVIKSKILSKSTLSVQNVFFSSKHLFGKPFLDLQTFDPLSLNRILVSFHIIFYVQSFLHKNSEWVTLYPFAHRDCACWRIFCLKINNYTHFRINNSLHWYPFVTCGFGPAR